MTLLGGTPRRGVPIALYATRWNVYPSGKRTELNMVLKRRYRVMDDGSLTVVAKNE
jgi:hypothetical protein